MGCTASTPDTQAPPGPTRGGHKGRRGRKGRSQGKRAAQQQQEEESQTQTSVTWLEKASGRTSGSRSPGEVLTGQEGKAPLRAQSAEDRKGGGPPEVIMVREAPGRDTEEPPRLAPEMASLSVCIPVRDFTTEFATNYPSFPPQQKTHIWFPD